MPVYPGQRRASAGRHETITSDRRSDLETGKGYCAYPVASVRVRKMVETVTVVLGLLCVGIFLAHAVDAYREP
jgi:hypothetical protein